MATVHADPKSRPRPGPRAAHFVAAALVFAALGWSYLPSFTSLVGQWNRDPNYSYGFFVIPIALFILWDRLRLVVPEKVRPALWGLLPLFALMGLRYLLYEWNEQYVETATIPLVIACLTLVLGGWHLFTVALPSIVFLFFMLPMPPSLNDVLAGPLQRLATLGSVTLLQIFGLPVMAEGNVIVVGEETLEVARACNGLSMLLSFVTLITAVVLLVRRPLGERVVLMLSAVPIALISNILRITGTAMVYHYVGHDAGEKLGHDMAGWLMMPIALALVGLELKLMSWLVVEVEEVDAKSLLRRRTRGKTA